MMNRRSCIAGKDDLRQLHSSVEDVGDFNVEVEWLARVHVCMYVGLGVY